MELAHPKTLYRSHWLDSPWAQLPLLIVLGNVVPGLIRFGGSVGALEQPSVFNTIIASTTATIITWYVIEKMRYFAKSRRLSYVLPVNFVAFTLAYMILGLFRLPYSVVLASVNFAVVLGFSFIFAVATRRSGIRQWLVPGGQVDQVIPELDHYSILDIEQLSSLIAAPDPRNTIIADLHHPYPAEWEAMLAEAAVNGLPVYHYRQILEAHTGQVRIDHLRENNFGSLIPNLGYTTAKRTIDLIAALILLPILLPIFAIVAVLIKLDSHGPVFFHQTRVGFRGRHFTIHKFRSLTVVSKDTEEETGSSFGLGERSSAPNSRQKVTRIGGFLRRTRIDELPQIVNIIRGDMSWIGPRPEAEWLSNLYEQKIPFYRYRHIVRPGITGWAQVNQGHVVEVDDVSTKLRYDFYYVRNISLWLDALVTMKTFRIVLGGYGAK